MTINPSEIPRLLRKHGLSPNKQLGQNFLIDAQAIEQIINVAEINPNDQVIEIGSGLGQLTSALAINAKSVISIELDTRFIPILKKTLQPFSNVTIIQGDFLKINLPQLLETEGFSKNNYLVVANIPYYITSALIRKLLESKTPPKKLVLTIQKEIAERITANKDHLSILAISVQIYGTPRIEFTIPSTAFYPTPKVDSAVVVVERHQKPLVPANLLPLFFRVVKAGFSQKRKQLRNSLSAGMHWAPSYGEEVLLAANIDPKRRAETLSISEWLTLTALIQSQLSQ